MHELFFELSSDAVLAFILGNAMSHQLMGCNLRHGGLGISGLQIMRFEIKVKLFIKIKSRKNRMLEAVCNLSQSQRQAHMSRFGSKQNKFTDTDSGKDWVSGALGFRVMGL